MLGKQRQTERFQSTSSTLHLQLIKYIKLFQLLLLLLWCESLCFSALLCFNKFELVQYSSLLCPFLFSSTLLCSFSATYNQQLDFSLWPKPAQLCSTTASPNCCGLSPHQSASVLKKKAMFVAGCSAFIYILSHTQGVESAWSLLHGPTAA